MFERISFLYHNNNFTWPICSPNVLFFCFLHPLCVQLQFVLFSRVFFLPIRSAKHTNLSAAVKIEESKKRNKLHVWKGKIYFIEMGDRE